MLLVCLVACQPSAVTELNPTASPGATILVSRQVVQATISSTVAAPDSTIAPTVAAPPSPTSLLTSTPEGLAASTQSPLSTEVTETPPPPTFTPPPPPPPVEGEKLWLQRPVPSSSPSWTDKSYPYGSTRGGVLRPHTGVEFVVPVGTPVLATASGVIVAAGDDAITAYGPQTNFYGRLVIIELGNTAGATPIFALYGHLSEVGVTVGQPVAAGEVVGLSGSTGVADGPHLHFEVRVGQNSYDSTRNPLLWLKPLDGTGVVAGRVMDSGGELLYEAPLTLIRADARAPYTATTSYANGEPNGDPVMGENFAVDDVVPGFYQAVVDTGTRRFTSDVWVYPGRTNWVEVAVGP